MKDRSGSLRLLVGGLLIIGSMFLLAPGISSAAAIVYKDSGQDPSAATLALGVGGLIFLAGLVLMIVGLLRRRSYNKRVVTYGDVDTPGHADDQAFLGDGRRVTSGRLEARLRRQARNRTWPRR